MYMGNLKSLLLLWENLASNQRYQSYVEEADLSTFKHRAEHEGLTFLTTVLPGIGKALDNYHATMAWSPVPDFKSEDWFINVKSVEKSHRLGSFMVSDIPPSQFPNWERDGYIIASIPKFLGTAVRCALEGDSLAVDCVRQLAYAFYKLEVKHDAGTIEQFLVNFRNIDSGLVDFSHTEDSNTLRILKHMRLIISRVLCNTNPRDIRPCHGSGSTACRTANWEKYHKFSFFRKLDDVYPYSENFFFSPTHLADELYKLEEAPVVDVPRARIVLVPKDSRGPRVISCEPAEMMYIQQGLMRLLYETLETHPLTSGQLNFVDQTINRQLAYLSSIDGKMATIDLSDASDRVSLSLVRAVFPPNWVECLEACRSEETVLPDQSVVKLQKFAPMGSSCCFPVEALVFWACAHATLHLASRDKIRTSSLKGKKILSPWPVYVYGDDIITPSFMAGTVMEGLELIGLKVNRNKSFVEGNFRESCGGDYHNGYDVTPVRVRKFPSNRGTGVHTCADLANSLIAKFGYTDSLPLIRVIEEEIGYVFPRTLVTIPGTLRVPPSASNDAFFRRRFNKNLQRFEHRVLGLACLVKLRQSPSWGELLRMALQRSGTDSAGPYEHWSKPVDAQLEPGQYADTHSAHQKWGWAWLG